MTVYSSSLGEGRQQDTRCDSSNDWFINILPFPILSMGKVELRQAKQQGQKRS